MADFSVWTGRSRLALLVGIDQYAGGKLHRLSGCVNDLDSLEAVLTQYFDFSVVCLRDTQATRETILAALQAMLDAAQEDHQILFGFSGHGSSLSLPNGETFQTLVPVDSGRDSWKENRDLTDREIFAWIWQMSQKTPFITLIIDACQSGSIVRDLQSRPRGVAGDIGGSAYVAQDKNAFMEDMPRSIPEKAPSGWLPNSDRYVLLAACLSTERSCESEDRDTGQTRGLFSLQLHRALIRARGGMTWRHFFEEVADAVNRENARQHPQLEGNLDLVLFGQEKRLPKPFLLVLSREGDSLFLEGGAAQGVQLASRWSLNSSGSTHAGENRLGEIEIVAVDATRCEGRLGSRLPAGLSEVGWRAFEIHRPLDHRLRVVLDPGAAATTRLLPLLDDSAYLHIETRAEETIGDLVLYRIPAGLAGSASDPIPHLPKPKDRATWLFVDPHSGNQLLPPFAAEVVKTELGEVVDRLERLARQNFLKRLSHPGDRPAAHATVEVKAYRIVETPGAPDRAIELEKGAVLDFEDRVAFRLSHRHAKPLQVTLLSLGLTAAVTKVFPERGRFEPLAPERTLEIGFHEADALVLHRPESFPFPGDEHPDTADEHLLFLFTEQNARNPDLVAQPAVRAGRVARRSTPLDLAWQLMQNRIVRNGPPADQLAQQETWGLLHWKIPLRLRTAPR